MTSSAAEGYASVIAARIASERLTLAARWLERLREMLTVTANDVFPSDQLLDHIPSLVQEISRYLAAPEAEALCRADRHQRNPVIRNFRRQTVAQPIRGWRRALRRQQFATPLHLRVQLEPIERSL